LKILLTGATGFLGFRTLEKLIGIHNISKIIATGRVLKKTHKINHPKATYILGDLTDKKFVQQLVAQVDYIIHTAALSSPWGKYEEFRDANLISQINLIEAATQNRIHKFIFISTPSLYFNSLHRFNIKESDPLPRKFINAYAETKRLAEIELEKSTIPYIIFRPRALTGRGDTVIMPRLIRAFDEGKLKIIGTGKNIVDLTSVANVVDAIILGLNATSEATNEIYNISNDEPVYLWEKIDLVLKLLNKNLSPKKVPYQVVNTLAHFLEGKSILTNRKEPALTIYSAGTLAKSFTMDISKAKTLLGFKPKINTDEAIYEFINWYIENEKG